MKNNYKPIKLFKVFIITENNVMSITKNYVLEDTNFAFDDKHDDIDWIDHEGDRQTDYVILEVSRKP
jgi:hypothetical protein